MKKLLTALTASTAFMAVSAHAALPAAVGTAFTSLQTDSLELIDLAWVPMTAVFGAFLLMKLFKRAGNKL